MLLSYLCLKYLILFYVTFEKRKIVGFHLLNSLKSFDKNSADKLQSKKYQHIKNPMAV
jgi:hypothetical protein